ncbi:MAG: ComEC/Rec2 family competence protein [Phototrophicaceae bacterium]
MRLVYIALGWIAGIVIAAASAPYALTWAVLALLVAVIVWRTWDAPGYRWANIVLLALTLGALRFSLLPSAGSVADYNDTGGLTLTGVVIAEPDIRDDRVLLRVEVDRLERVAEDRPVDGRVLVRASRHTDARYGDRVRATGMLYTPAVYDTFSYADYLAREGVYSLLDYAIVSVEPGGHGSGWLAAVHDARRATIDTVNRYLPEPQAGLLAGILTGSERSLSPDLAEAFRAAGASHIIAISGFNMIVVAGVVMGVLRHTPLSPRWTAALGLAAIVVYTAFAGGTASVLRAALMSSLLIIGQSLNRRTYVPASLAFAALALSLVDPHVLWDVGFQLSLFATLGLSLFVEPISRGLNRAVRWLFAVRAGAVAGGLVLEPLAVTLAAQITALPIVLLHFERLSLVAVPVNALIIPVQAYLFIVGGAATLLWWLPPLAQLLYWLDYLLLSWTIGVVRFFGALPFADTMVYVRPWFVALYFAVLIGWAMMQATRPQWWLRAGDVLRQRTVTAAVAFAGLGLATLMIIVALSRPPGDRLDVWFLDAGHSNAVLLQTPGGAHMLVDGGRYPSRLLTAIGDRLPFIDRRLDVVVVTQPDEMDTAALTSVMARYEAGVVLTNGQPNQGNAYAELQSALAAYPVVEARAGYTLELSDGVRVEVLHPQREPTLVDRLNDQALALRVQYGDVSFLLTGDLSPAAQESMLAAGQWPSATVLQLPDHGAARSLHGQFVDAVQPSLMVVQADRANRRGDPDPDLLAALPPDMPLYRTDQHGTVHVWTDGQRLFVEP